MALEYNQVVRLTQKAPNPSDVASTIRIKLTGDGTPEAYHISFTVLGQ